MKYFRLKMICLNEIHFSDKLFFGFKNMINN